MTAQPIRIRDATMEDAEAIRAIYNHAVMHTTAVFDYAPREAQAQRAWMQAKAEQKLPVLVAEQDGQVVGYSSYGPYRPWPAYLHSVENSVYVAPEHHGKGIGKRLLGPLLEVARARNVHTVIAGITGGNEASLRLHRAFGFESAGTVREAGWKFEQWLDVIFLQKIFR
jgi:L-amino acid N-acyltransferase